MVQYRIPLQMNYGREKADGSGMQPGSSVGVANVVGAIDSSFAGGYEIAFNIPRWAHIVDCKISFEGGVVAELYTNHGRGTWNFLEATPAYTHEVNGGIIAISDQLRNRIIVAGGAAAATAVDGTTFNAIVRWKLGPGAGLSVPLDPGVNGACPPQWSSALFSEYGDDAEDDDPPLGILTGLFTRMEQLFAGVGGGGSGSAGSAVEFAVSSPPFLCSAAFTDPFGAVFVTAADLGNGPGQIPTDTSLWLASQFRQHPSVFTRYPKFSRAVGTALPFGAGDTTPIGNGANPQMNLWEVTRAPSYSSWLLITDGLPSVVTFQHPAGSDLRRPLDIWNGLIVPTITGRSAPGTPGPLGTPQNLPAANAPAVTWDATPALGLFPLGGPYTPNAFSQRGMLPRRMEHLQYARLLELWDESTQYDDPPYIAVTLNPE